MMYLLTPTEIASALQRSNCGSDSETVDQLMGILLQAQTRLETTLEVDTLERGTFTDIFEVTDADVLPREVRLVNAFLVPDQPILLSQYGVLSDPDDPFTFSKVLPETGIVSLPRTGRGRYSIVYTSGFAKDDNNYAIDVPDWLKGLCLTMVLHWFRIGLLTPRVQEGISYTSLIDSAIREIMTRKHMRYDRPRADVVFAERGYYGNGA